MSPASTRVPRIALATALFVAPVALLLLQYGAGRDQGVYLAVARVMQAGGMPYRDAWDVKPPGIFLLYRLALAFGGGMLPVRVLEALAVLSQVLAFGIFTKRFAGSAVPGLWGGVFAALLHARLEFWHTGQPESFGGPVLAWALVLATSPRRVLAARLAAGALFGFAALLKPPLGGGLVTTAALLGWREGRGATARRARAALGPALALCLGAAAAVGLTLAWFAFRGALPDLIEVFRDFVPRYAALGPPGEGAVGRLLHALLEWLVGFSALVAGGAALLLICREDGEGLWGLGLVCGIVAPQIVGIALQGKFFSYHYGAALPFGALLAAWGGWRAWRRTTGWLPRLAGLALAILLVRADGAPPHAPWLSRIALRWRAAVTPGERSRILDALQSTPDIDAGANRAAARWVRGATPPGSTLFVWGYDPVLYDDAARAPASRYVYDVPLRAPWYVGASRPRLLEDLARARPAAILVERGDAVPLVAGDTLDSAGALESFPEFREILARDYTLAADTGRFVCWLRRGSP